MSCLLTSQIDPQLHCDHQHLKTARETQRRIEQDLSQSSEQLTSEKTRNSQLEQEVENYRTRQKHIADLKHYQMKRPWIVRFAPLLWHVPLGVRSAVRRHQPPQRVVLS